MIALVMLVAFSVFFKLVVVYIMFEHLFLDLKTIQDATLQFTRNFPCLDFLRTASDRSMCTRLGNDGSRMTASAMDLTRTLPLVFFFFFLFFSPFLFWKKI